MTQLAFSRSLTNAIKIVAAICIAFFHHSYYVWADNLHFFSVDYDISSKLASWGIAIFFFFSGYGLMESELRKPLVTFSSFLKARILKIYIPMVLVTLLWLPLYLPTVAETPTNMKELIIYAGQALVILLWKGGDVAIWFIRSLLQLYLVFFFFAKFLRGNQRVKAWMFMLIGTATIYLLKCGTNSFQALSIPPFVIVVFASFFKNKNGRGFNITLLPLAVFGIVAALFHRNAYISEMLLQNYGFVAFIILICTNIKIKLPHIPVLGDFSFDIYLVHKKVLTVAFDYLGCGISLGLFSAITLLISGTFYLLRTKTLLLVTHK